MQQDGVLSHIENRALTPDEIGLLAGLITDEPDHYTVLGVSRSASREEIQAAYCLAAEYFHPLKSTESDSAMCWKLSSAFNRIQEAFDVLSSRSRGKVYEEKLFDVRPHNLDEELCVVGAFVFCANQDAPGAMSGPSFA